MIAGLAPKITGKRSFIAEDFDVKTIAELISANIINHACSKVVAVKDLSEQCQPDLRLLDRKTNELVGYVEVQSITNFEDYSNYRYKDFLWYERRNFKYYGNYPVAFLCYDLNWGSTLLTSYDRIKRAMETCPIEYKDRWNYNHTEVIQPNEKIYHLPLSIFKFNSAVDKLDGLNNKLHQY